MNFIAQFLQRAILQGTPLLFGATGEIITEKSGNLNLGIPGIMYVGAISGVIGGFFYQSSVKSVNPFLAIMIPLLSCLLGSLLVSLIYSFLTITLHANQNVTGLALTTFGVGFGNFFGGSLIKITKSEVPYVALTKIAKYYHSSFPFAKKLGWFGTLFFSYGFLVYLALILAIVATVLLKKSKVGLHLRAVGENPATADAAGIPVTGYKYFATCIGGMVAGLGGLYFIMDYSGGIWSNNGFGDRGWLAIAIVIFAIWRPNLAIFASYLFGGLYILFNYINASMQLIPIIQMIPYVVTILALILTSIRKKRENQPPAALGQTYFREDR
ncbi:MAG: ABC transporter permease [Clostridia bacterium]|nr:ABC transporter permease [Clostridia bacterium]MDY6185364.1 ABC transporter permease [Eubacteriales bacterium]